MMNLTIDIGNTTTVLCYFKNDKLLKAYAFPTNSHILTNLKKVIPKLIGSTIQIGISSVVPSIDKKVKHFIFRGLKCEPLFINSRIKLPIKLKIKTPSQLGADRICGSSAAYFFYGKNKNLIVVDTGTANTFDIILKDGSFVGGVISPGLVLSFVSLHTNTAQLPLLYSKKIPGDVSLIGRETVSCIRSGVFYNYIDGINSMLSRIKKDLGGKCKIIITGGNSTLLKKYLQHKAEYRKYLVSEGINLILKMNHV